jgi:hypothetical protein
VDRFDTRNRFYGGQVGTRAEYCWKNFVAGFTGKLALGASIERININGATEIFPPSGRTIVNQGGLLALPSNIGEYNRSEFAVVPEIGINVGYQVTDHIRLFVGYTFLYESDVVRAGDQIDRGINGTQLVRGLRPGTLIGPPRPAFASPNATDFWAQGVNFGLQIRY